MYTGDFTTEEKTIIRCFVTSNYGSRTVESLAKQSGLSVSKVRYIINRSKLIKSKGNNNMFTLV